MSVIVDVVINTDQAEQQLQALQQQMADDLAAGAAQMGQAAGRAAGATARAAGKNATEEFLRAFDPDKLRAELESAGLGEQEIEIILDTTKAKAETQALKDSIATALSQASGLAEDQLKQITAQVAREVDRAAGKVKSVTEIVDGVRDLKGEIQDLGAAGQAAGEGIGMLVLNETVDKFGDLKDIFEKSAGAILGMSEAAVEATVRVGDLAEKGAMVGAAFGPMGAVIGLVAGGALGVLVEKLNASSQEALAAAEGAKVYEERLERLKVAASVAVSQEELNKALEDYRVITVQQNESLLLFSQAQELASNKVKEATEKIAAYEKELAQVRSGELDYAATQREKELLFAISITKTRDLTAAEAELASMTAQLTARQRDQLATQAQIAAAQGIAAIGILESAQAIEDQLNIILTGSKFVNQSTESLQQRQAELTQQLKAGKNAVESYGLQNLELAEQTDGLSNAVENQTANQEQANNVTEAAKLKLVELAEITGELKSRTQENTASTSVATKVAKEETKQIAEKALVVEATNPIYKELVDLERQHYDILLRKAKVERGDILDLGYLEDPIDAANQAAKNAEAAGKDLMTLLEEDGRSVEQKVQDKIDALREAKEQAAKEMQQQLAEKGLADLAKAQQDAARANVEEYKKILQPYTEFIGTVFTDFTNGMLAGQSATEAFAEATRKAIAAALGSLAKELGVKSLASLAEGFAALSNPFTAAAAPGFFKASALYAAAAAAAGLGSSVLSTAGANSGASGLGAAGGGAAGTAAAAGNTSTSLGRAAQEAGTPAPIVIDLRGAMFPTTDLTAAQSFGEAVARSLAAASAGNQPMARRLIGSRGFVV